MAHEFAAAIEKSVKAHAAATDQDIVHLRGLTVHERSVLLERACKAAAIINRSRMAAGLPADIPAPWPPSTWEFLRKHAARVRT
jgi:hypothetical protein